MTTNNVTATSLRPIYGPSDPRWSQLADYLVVNFDERTGPIDDLTPTERVRWYENYVVGSDREGRPDIEYPDFPDDAPRPAWATGYDDTGVAAGTEHPVRLWHHDLGDEGVPAAIVQEATFDPDTGTITSGPALLSAWITGNEAFESADPMEIRRVAQLLLERADQFEAVMAQ